MQQLPLVWWVVLVAGLARFMFGWLWYSALFGKAWMQESGVSEKDMKSGMGKAIPTDLITCVVMAFVLAHAVKYAMADPSMSQTPHLAGGMVCGFFNWLGFIVPILLGSVIYEKKSMKLFWINAGYNLITLMIMGAILALWA